MREFDNVKGAERYQTEGDYRREVDNADRRAARQRRFRAHLTVDGPDSTAVLYSCGCVAAVKHTEAAAKSWLDWQNDNPATDPDKWWGAYLVPAYAVFDGPVLTVYGRDDAVLPMPGRPSAAGCDVHASTFDRRTA